MSQKVLVMDSGIGGLTVLQHIQQQLPQVHCHYLADNDFFPYGSKTELELEQRIEQLLLTLLRNQHFDAVIIACNSASTAVLDYLRSRFKFPIIGMVPAIKPAAQLTQNKTIGLLATEGTVNRPYTDQLINDFASDCKVIRIASAELVTYAEMKINGLPVERSALKAVIQPFIDENVDVVVLGCTHFPWFKQEFSEIARYIQWIDSGDAIARRLKQVLKETESVATESLTDQEISRFYFTGKSYPIKLTETFEMEPEKLLP